jgi:hypothetical protein
VGVLGLLLGAGCAEPTVPPIVDPGSEPPDDFCTVSEADLLGILGPDQIPALTDPPLVGAESPEAAWLSPESRVMGLIVAGEPLAVPLGILRHHEIVNLTLGDEQVAVTYCPLTGSGLAFDRSSVDGADFGVSGILFRNNLVMFDRADTRSFFPQMLRRAGCGPRARSRPRLAMVASWEIRWDAWKSLYPDTRVVSEQTGYGRAYHINLNAEYDRIDNPDRLVPVPLDPRRPPKERVLGVPISRDGGPAFPFEALKRHERLTFPLTRDGRPAVVLWDRAAEAAMTFWTDLNGSELTLHPHSDGFRDAETGSRWRLDGLAVAGPLAGSRLEPLAEAYVAFWYAWADFHPETVVRVP